MKKYILLLLILCATQAQAQWGGWARFFTKSGANISLAVSADTLNVPNGQLRIGTSTTAGFVPVADARGVLTMQSVSGSGGLTAADSTGNVLQTKSENNALYGQLAAQNAWTASNTFAATSGIVFLPYGSGAGTTTNLRFRELSANGTNYLGWKAPDNISANAVYVMPRPGSAGLPLLYGATDTTYFGQIEEAAMNWAQQNADSVFSALPAKMKQIVFKASFLDTVLVGDSLMVAHEPYAITIDSIWATTNTGTATIFFDHRAHTTPRTRGTNIETSGMVADAYEASTAFDDATIPANAPIFMRVTATASSVKQLWVAIFARKD